MVDDGCNRFFLRTGAEEQPRKRRVYAAYEVPEPDAEGEERGAKARPQLSESTAEPVLLECVDSDWFHSLAGSSTWLEHFRGAPISVLELRGYPLPPSPPGLNPGQIAWYEFGYTPVGPGEADAAVYTNLYSAGAPVKISFHEPRPASWAAEGPFSTRGGSMAWEMPEFGSVGVEALIEEASEPSTGVALYDVGQGSCQALLQDPRGVPGLYVDFGGGVLGNTMTFPSGYHGFCFSANPPVLLSHWDWDHWSSAYRFPRALQADWIAPPVPPKPVQLSFAAHLHTLKRLTIWNRTTALDVLVGGVRLERCTGRTANDSGIAVTAYRSSRGSKSCLLPGDADYRHIPSVLSGTRFSAICITHHGGRLHSAVLPTPKRRGAKCVCSVGAGNSYQHPFLETYEAHAAAGWPMPLTTGFTGHRPSHVFIPWDAAPRVFTGSCLAQPPRCSVAFR